MSAIALLILLVVVEAQSPPKPCPKVDDLQKNTVTMSTASGYHLGYALANGKEVKWFQSSTVSGFAFHWNFQVGSGTNYQIIPANRTDGMQLACGEMDLAPWFHCQLLPASDVRCAKLGNCAFQVAPSEEGCALQYHNLVDYFKICVKRGSAVPKGCSVHGFPSDDSQIIFAVGGGPGPSNCTPSSRPVGQWMPAGFSSVPNDYTLSVGVSHEYSKSNTVTWGVEASNSLNLGFSYQGATIGDTISGKVSRQWSKSYSATLTQTKTEEHTWHFGAGQVWQFQFSFTDPCGSSTVLGTDIALTNSRDDPPCCLPGYSKNASVPHGPCLPCSDGKVYDVCKPSLVGIVV